jgi:hypothetical protein
MGVAITLPAVSMDWSEQMHRTGEQSSEKLAVIKVTDPNRLLFVRMFYKINEILEFVYLSPLAPQ